MADIQTFNDQETSNVLIYLVEITHTSLSQPVRLCSNNEDVSYGGNTYLANNLYATLIQDSPNSAPQGSVTIQNISGEIREIYKDLYTSPVVKIALYNTLGDIEKGFYTFDSTGVTYNYTDATITLKKDLGFDYDYPRFRYDRTYGGLES